MTEAELDGLGSALDDFLEPYLFCCGYTQTFGHLHTYCRGLLSDLKRKTAEPIALAAGCAVPTLQEFRSWKFCSPLGFPRHACSSIKRVWKNGRN
jgi:hypothetical protein